LARFGLVDAAFGPVFRYFEVIPPGGLFERLPRVAAWRAALAARPSVRAAVPDDYAALLRGFLLARGAALSRQLGR
jgi:glutathione S-transferase